jgi:hypothetical protein
MKDKAAVRERGAKEHSSTQHPPVVQEESGGSWQFIAVLIIIGIGVLGLILKSTGLF